MKLRFALAISLLVTCAVLLAVGCAYQFSKYEPGKRLSATEYKSAVKDLDDSFSIAKLVDFNKKVDREMLAAMHETFSNASDFPNTRVIFGSAGTTGDGQYGIRVIWRRKVPARGVDISINVFYGYLNGKFVPKGGEDSIRVRSLLASGQSGWLSYSTTLAADGSITSLAPGQYQLANEDMQSGIPSEAAPTRCDGCHYHNMPSTNPESESDYTPDKNWGVSSALSEAPEAARKGLEHLFLNPRSNFLPPGILKAISARAQEIGL